MGSGGMAALVSESQKTSHAAEKAGEGHRPLLLWEEESAFLLPLLHWLIFLGPYSLAFWDLTHTHTHPFWGIMKAVYKHLKSQLQVSSQLDR